MAVQWDLALPRHDFGQIALAGFEQGKQMRRERETDNALAAYAQNQDDPNAVNALLRVNPRIGMQLQDQQRQRQMAAQQQQVTAGALQGDQGSMDALAGLNPEMWMKLDDRVKDQVKQATSFMSQAGMEIGRLPEEQRGPVWESYVRQAESMGLDIPTQYERYSPEGFRAAMAESGKMGEFLKSIEPDFMALQAGGTVYSKPMPTSPFAAPTPQSAQPQSMAQPGGQFIKRSEADALRRSDPAKYEQLVRGGAKVVPDNFNEILDEARAAIAKGADPAAVTARAQQLLGVQ